MLLAISSPVKESISCREKQILRLLCGGLTCKQVAIQLHISPDTVKSHRRNLYLKLGVKTGVQLGAITITNNLL